MREMGRCEEGFAFDRRDVMSLQLWFDQADRLIMYECKARSFTLCMIHATSGGV